MTDWERPSDPSWGSTSPMGVEWAVPPSETTPTAPAADPWGESPAGSPSNMNELPVDDVGGSNGDRYVISKEQQLSNPTSPVENEKGSVSAGDQFSPNPTASNDTALDFLGSIGTERKTQNTFDSPVGSGSSHGDLTAMDGNTNGAKSEKPKSTKEMLDDMKKSLTQKGQAKKAQIEQEASARQAKADAESAAALATMKSEAAEYLQKYSTERANKIAMSKKVHVEEQAKLKEQNKNLQAGGNLWQQVHSLVNFYQTPHKHSQKSTEKMRALMAALKDKEKKK